MWGLKLKANMLQSEGGHHLVSVPPRVPIPLVSNKKAYGVASQVFELDSESRSPSGKDCTDICSRRQVPIHHVIEYLSALRDIGVGYYSQCCASATKPSISVCHVGMGPESSYCQKDYIVPQSEIACIQPAWSLNRGIQESLHTTACAYLSWCLPHLIQCANVEASTKFWVFHRLQFSHKQLGVDQICLD